MHANPARPATILPTLLLAGLLAPWTLRAQPTRALGDHLYVAGVRADAGKSPEQQIHQALDRLEQRLVEAGTTLAQVVELRVALADIRHYSQVDAIFRQRFSAGAPAGAPARAPAMSTYEVELAEAGAVVELNAVAAKAGVDAVVINPEGWPRPQGYFSRAVRAGDTLFLAGQVGYDVVRGETPATVALQAQQALANVTRLVESAGMTLDQVVACRVYLADPRDFPAMNEAWRAVFKKDPPVRETIRSKLGDAEFKVEVACTAVAGAKKVVLPPAYTPGAPFSPAIAVGNRLYTAGHVARGATGWPTGAEAQARDILAKLRALLEAAQLNPSQVVDATVFVSDIRLLEALQTPWREFFGDNAPSLTRTGAPLMAPEALVEISFIAELPAPK